MSAPDARVEVRYDATWNTVPATEVDTSRQAMTVNYGRPDSHSEAVPTAVSQTLENPDRKWSPKDPSSVLYGKIGTGTQLRTRIGGPQVALALQAIENSYASTPDAASLDIVGDIDVRVELKPDTWRPSLPYALMAKWQTGTGPQVAFAMRLHPAGQLLFSWSSDGTNAGIKSRTSTAAIPANSGRLAVRAILDVDNGASGHTVRFYTATSLAGAWTQLGADVITAGTTSIFASTANLELGRANDGLIAFAGDGLMAGRVFAAELRNGIAGSLVASPDFTTLQPGNDSFTDGTGLVWTLNDRATRTDPSLRGSVRITKFLPSWNRTARDARQNLTATGLLDSLGTGEPLHSSLFRDLSTKDSVVAYWPMEDGAQASGLASAFPGHPSMTLAGAVSLAAYSGFVASQPVPTFNASAIASYASATIPAYAGAADQRVISIVHVPDAGVTASNRQVWGLVTTGTATTWTINVIPGAGDLQVDAFNAAGANILSSGALGFATNGKHIMLSLWLSQVGANIDWQVAVWEIGSGAAAALGGTLAGATYGRFTTAVAGPSFDLAGTAVGHFAILNGDVESVWDLVGRSLVGWAGESVAERMARLSLEEGVPLRLVGDPDDTELVGPQGTNGFLSILDDAAETDGGWLGERRDYPGLLYRTRADLYNQAPKLTLDMAQGEVANPFAPPLDVQQVRNDITVTRESGTSYRAVQETGPNNIQDPDDDPQGIGARYKDPKTLSLYTDGQVRDQATWRLHLGTVDEHRIASLDIEMEHHPDLVQAVLELEGGDLIRILHPPPGLGPGPLDLIAMGWTDTIDDETWHVRINCAPGSSWTVAAVSTGDDELRAHSDGSTVAADFVAGTGTSLSVATTSTHPYLRPLWTTDAGEMPMQIVAGGVVLNVTAVSGTSSPQALTVDAIPVNGVLKTIAAGTPVQVNRPMPIPL